MRGESGKGEREQGKEEDMKRRKEGQREKEIQDGKNEGARRE